MSASPSHRHVTGHNGNEIYCLNAVNMRPGQLCVGNSVIALGMTGGLGAGLRALAGGEVTSVSALVNQARKQALQRLLTEARAAKSHGVTGISFEIVNHNGNFEFLALGSGVYTADAKAGAECFSAAGDAQQLFCLIDAGFDPKHFVFGNVAYALGVGGNLRGGLQGMRRGEVAQYSKIFDTTRHLALQRIEEDARKHHANTVVGIEMSIAPLLGAQEMVVTGTAADHPLLPHNRQDVFTSDMTLEETWNMAHLGYLPLQLVMGVSVYSLGLARKFTSLLDSLAGGELGDLSEVLYDARAQALARIEEQAHLCGADEVVGIKLKVYDLGFGLVEVLAIGTAVQKVDKATTRSALLPAQAVIRDRETILTSDHALGLTKGERKVSQSRAQGGPLRLLLSLLTVGFLFYMRIRAS